MKLEKYIDFIIIPTSYLNGRMNDYGDYEIIQIFQDDELESVYENGITKNIPVNRPKILLGKTGNLIEKLDLNYRKQLEEKNKSIDGCINELQIVNKKLIDANSAASTFEKSYHKLEQDSSKTFRRNTELSMENMLLKDDLEKIKIAIGKIQYDQILSKKTTTE